MKQAVHLLIYGVVQGVYFRQRTMEEAKRLKVSGWVRNCEDGSVEAEAEGDEAALKKFIEWCHLGPTRAVVTKVVIEDIKPKNFSSFEVRR